MGVINGYTKFFLSKTLGDAALIEVIHCVWEESVVGLFGIHGRDLCGIVSARRESSGLDTLFLLLPAIVFHFFPESFFGSLCFCDGAELRFVVGIDLLINRGFEEFLVAFERDKCLLFEFIQVVIESFPRDIVGVQDFHDETRIGEPAQFKGEFGTRLRKKTRHKDLEFREKRVFKHRLGTAAFVHLLNRFNFIPNQAKELYERLVIRMQLLFHLIQSTNLLHTLLE